MIITEQLKIARELDIQIVATNNVHYTEKAHAVPHNVLLMIQNLTTDSENKVDVENLRFQSKEFYFKSKSEMIELFKDLPEAIENTVKIADMCNVELDLKSNYMPASRKIQIGTLKAYLHYQITDMFSYHQEEFYLYQK